MTPICERPHEESTSESDRYVSDPREESTSESDRYVSDPREESTSESDRYVSDPREEPTTDADEVCVASDGARVFLHNDSEGVRIPAVDAAGSRASALVLDLAVDVQFEYRTEQLAESLDGLVVVDLIREVEQPDSVVFSEQIE